jgi:D-alanyl-D-alanine carboxypeptidase
MPETAVVSGRRCLAASVLGIFVAVAAVHPADARHASRHAEQKPAGNHGGESAHAEAFGPRYAAIVVDANTGAVLHAANPDELRHPASLTKIMTLYLLFEQLEAGKLRLDTPLSVSEHAAAQSPTKLGLRPGQTIEVENAILGLVTKSANDAAVVIGEAIAGDEHDFAEMMTRKAHALGMSRTVYRNASGLPNDEQVTTARDQALLGRAIQERFPRESRYFATPSFTYHGVSMRNHNHLLGHVEGMDGIKTGYIAASGYNLVTSVRRNGRHIISVVLGGSTGAARDARMRTLIEEYIVAASPQSGATAFADATSARLPRTREVGAAELPSNDSTGTSAARLAGAGAAEPPRVAAARPAQKGTAEARTATRPNATATYVVASFDQRSVSPPSSAGAAGSGPAPLARVDAAPTAAVPTPPVRPSSASDPIRPIQVKTLKVKFPALQVAAAAPVEATPAPDLRDPAGPVTSRPAAVLHKPGAAAVASVQDPAAPLRAEPQREIVREVTRDAEPATAEPVQSWQRTPQTTPSTVPSPSGATTHSGWIIQVGAFEGEREAQEKLEAVRAKAAPRLGHADSFTEAVVKGDKTYYRARFAGLQKNEPEAICKQLKRNDIDCMTVKN